MKFLFAFCLLAVIVYEVSSDTIEEEVKEIIAEQLDVMPEQVTLETNLIDDLGAEDLDMIELKMNLEEQFDVEIPDENIGKLETVKDIVTYISAKML